MEEDIRHHKSLSTIEKSSLIIQRLEAAIESAQESIDYTAAHNPEMLYALEIVRLFLLKKRRICYGGTAINAILPPKQRFYDPEVDLPDYDFFTPDQESDMRELASDLRRAGFKEVYHKTGMHAGTFKVLVNYTPVADMTALRPDVYEIFERRAVQRGGILYTDPDMLRFMMFLELSRPRGEVGRWEKVYERLQLLQRAFPYDDCEGRQSRRKTKRVRKGLSGALREKIYTFIETNNRIIASQEYENVYTFKPKKTFDAPSTPILFISPEPKRDAYVLRQMLTRHDDIQVFKHVAVGEYLPERIVLTHKGQTVAVIIEENGCLSYITSEIGDHTFRVASPDMLLYLYFALLIFSKKTVSYFRGKSVECHIRDLLVYNEKNRAAKTPATEPFPIQCEGYQKGYPTLVKERIERIRKEGKK